jgi:predicted cupin superfamily sugar epimerase
MNRIKELRDLLGLDEHPEGGYFKETYRSNLIIQSPQVNAERSAMTDIYFMLTHGQVSRFHKVRHDELWNFYEGSALRLYDYDPQSEKIKIVTLGSIPDCDCYKYVIPADHWQAAVSLGDYSLVGCTVAPGFDFQDFTFFETDSPVKKKLLAMHPELARFV